MDVLGQVMTLLRTKGHIYGRLEALGDFNIRFPYEVGHCLIVTRGSCFLVVEGQKPVALVSGDFVILPTSKSFCLKSKLELKRSTDITPKQGEDYVQTGILAFGSGEGLPVSMISGCFSFAFAESRLLTEYLSPIIHLKGNTPNTPIGIQTILQMIENEITQAHPGSTTVIDRLSEVLLIHALRNHFESLSENNPSWLKALGDPQIGKSLSHMHEKPERTWTIEQLAKSVGMSRSAFATKFKIVVGKTPLEHLTEWRMFKAATMISDPTPMKMENIALAVGYESDRAFRQAFRKIMGSSPREYKQRNLNKDINESNGNH